MRTCVQSMIRSNQPLALPLWGPMISALHPVSWLQVRSSQQYERVELDDAHTAAAYSLSPDSRSGGNAASSHSAQTASDPDASPRTAANSRQHSGGDPQGRWQTGQSLPARARQSPSGSRQQRRQQVARHDARLPVAALDAHEPRGLRVASTAAGRQLLADAASPSFTVSPAQSGVRIDSPELRMNGAPTQLFQIDFGKATTELNPINLFTITGAVECASDTNPSVPHFRRTLRRV